MKRSTKSTSIFLNSEKELNYIPYWARNNSHHKLIPHNLRISPNRSHSKLGKHQITFLRQPIKHSQVKTSTSTVKEVPQRPQATSKNFANCEQKVKEPEETDENQFINPEVLNKNFAPLIEGLQMNPCSQDSDQRKNEGKKETSDIKEEKLMEVNEKQEENKESENESQTREIQSFMPEKSVIHEEPNDSSYDQKQPDSLKVWIRTGCTQIKKPEKTNKNLPSKLSLRPKKVSELSIKLKQNGKKIDTVAEMKKVESQKKFKKPVIIEPRKQKSYHVGKLLQRFHGKKCSEESRESKHF